MKTTYKTQNEKIKTYISAALDCLAESAKLINLGAKFKDNTLVSNKDVNTYVEMSNTYFSIAKSLLRMKMIQQKENKKFTNKRYIK